MMSTSRNNITDSCDFSFSNKEVTGKKKECDRSIGSNISNSSFSGGGNRKMKMMMSHHHHENQHRPSPSYEICCDDVTGPTWNTGPSTNIYHTMASGLVSGSGLKTLQPFDIVTKPTSEASQTVFKSPGMAASMGFPFTNAQWKELERQAMIFKYMMASVPVPPDLLFPIIRNSSAPLGSGLNIIRFSNRGDLEPGRCRRTDGKKWRCSRDVAPDQKYCERHLHRGRPRSRKHVELPANKKKSRLEPNPNTISTNSNSNNNFCRPFQFPGTSTQYHHIPSPEDATFQSIKELRCLDWMMKGEHLQMHSSAGAEWQHLMQQQQTGIEVDNSSVLTKHYVEEPLNLNSFSNFGSREDQFINSELVSLEKQTPRGFIDAWSEGGSNEEHNGNNGAKSSVFSDGNLILSPLSLSMGGKNVIDEEIGQVQMGLGLAESVQNNESSSKPPLSSWLNPFPWAASALGGPLAEVLRPSMVTASGSPSTTAGNGDNGSPPATAMSSPSGVLQKTLASLSDSSGSSSPLLATSRTNKP